MLFYFHIYLFTQVQSIKISYSHPMKSLNHVKTTKKKKRLEKQWSVTTPNIKQSVSFKLPNINKHSCNKMCCLQRNRIKMQSTKAEKERAITCSEAVRSCHKYCTDVRSLVSVFELFVFCLKTMFLGLLFHTCNSRCYT